MPNLHNLSSSALATANFSGSSRLALDWTGCPVVGMWCLTPCFGSLTSKDGVRIFVCFFLYGTSDFGESFLVLVHVPVILVNPLNLV